MTDENNSDVRKFLETFKLLKKCVEENRFTDGFEQAIKLKLILGTCTVFNPFYGDSDLSNLFRRMTKILTSRYFDILESVENKLKLENHDLSIKLLD